MPKPPAIFRRLILAAILMTYGLIVLGGVVRVTGSGMGCGPDWPLCDGQVVPPMRFATALEYAHRVVAGAVLLLAAALVVTGWRLRSINRWWFVLPLVAFGLVLAQATLGAITVFLDLHAEVTTIHHAVALAILALLLVLGVGVVRRDASASMSRFPLARSSLLRGVLLVALLLVYATMVVGAYTATTGAGYACSEWPECGGHVLPGSESFHINIHLLHRWLAATGALAVGVAAVSSRRAQFDGRLARLTDTAAGLMAIQVVLGAVNIWTGLSAWVVAAHLATGTLLLGALVVAVTLDRLGQPTAVRDLNAIPRAARSPSTSD